LFPRQKKKSGKKIGKSGKPVPLNPHSKKVATGFLFFQISCPKCEKQSPGIRAYFNWSSVSHDFRNMSSKFTIFGG